MKKKDKELIPLAKSRRVIYIERRGKRSKGMQVGAWIFGICGILCILYCIWIALFVEYGSLFFTIWGTGGVLLCLIGFLMGREALWSRIPVWVKAAGGSILGIGVAAVLVTVGMILAAAKAVPPDGADYCLILGAQIRQNGPSIVLKRRLDIAIDYLKKNPDTKVIVSGGQGANEPMTEAQGMAEYLVEHGIKESRILKEDKSRNTSENLSFSSAYLDKEQDEGVIVTNSFHVFRALHIAKKKGYQKVYGLAATSYMPTLPNNLLRECLGVWKDALVGNL